MMRGIAIFKCDKCGKIFTGLAMEWGATCFIMPLQCPKCGSFHTYPKGLTTLFGPGIYKKLWKSMGKD